MLIVKICGGSGEHHECEIIQQQAKMYGITPKIITPNNKQELADGLKTDTPYDFIYLSSHGNDEGICSHDNGIDMSWLEFGTLLCESECMAEGCVLMLSCCRGGLNQVAYDLFYTCTNIAYVVGPRQSLHAHDMQIAYSLFLYFVVKRDVDPVVACEKIKLATDIRFFFFDRLEVEIEPAYMYRVQDHESQNMEEAAKEEAKDLVNHTPGQSISNSAA